MIRIIIPILLSLALITPVASAAPKKPTTHQSKPKPGPRGPQGVPGIDGQRGAMGTQGIQGVQGLQGVKGDKGISALDTLQSGSSIHGVIVGGIGMNRTTSPAVPDMVIAGATFPIPIPEPPKAVVVKLNNVLQSKCDGACFLEDNWQELQTHCNGTVDSPTASPGYVCIYPVRVVDVTQFNGQPLSIFGFSLRWQTQPTSETFNNRSTSFEGVWAYTAP